MTDCELELFRFKFLSWLAIKLVEFKKLAELIKSGFIVKAAMLAL